MAALEEALDQGIAALDEEAQAVAAANTFSLGFDAEGAASRVSATIAAARQADNTSPQVPTNTTTPEVNTPAPANEQTTDNGLTQ